MTTAFIIFAGTIWCHGQSGSLFTCNRIGIDLAAGICFGKTEIITEHSFLPNWSAGAGISLATGLLKRPVSEAESTHLKAISGDDRITNPEEKFRQTFQEICIYADYWPHRAFRGPHVCIGGRIRDRDGPDLILGVGYAIHIWRGLSTDIMYRSGIIETYKDRRLPADGIKAGIHYVF